MSSRSGILVGLGLVAAAAIYAVSVVWPTYDWRLLLPSPDGRYDLVAIRGDAAAFADFSYRLYVFPHDRTPQDRPKGTRVWFAPPWRGSRYLIYSGYNYPMFRWTGPSSVEIDLTDAIPGPLVLEAVKVFDRPDAPIVTSLVFGRDDPANFRL